jgi:hypothetical protein
MKSRLLNNFLDFELRIPWFAVEFCLDRRVGFERGCSSCTQPTCPTADAFTRRIL